MTEPCITAYLQLIFHVKIEILKLSVCPKKCSNVFPFAVLIRFCNDKLNYLCNNWTNVLFHQMKLNALEKSSSQISSFVKAHLNLGLSHLLL